MKTLDAREITADRPTSCRRQSTCSSLSISRKRHRQINPRQFGCFCARRAKSPAAGGARFQAKCSILFDRRFVTGRPACAIARPAGWVKLFLELQVMRRLRDRHQAGLFRGAELPRLMTMVVMLFVLAMMIRRASDRDTWRYFTGESAGSEQSSPANGAQHKPHARPRTAARPAGAAVVTAPEVDNELAMVIEPATRRDPAEQSEPSQQSEPPAQNDSAPADEPNEATIDSTPAEASAEPNSEPTTLLAANARDESAEKQEENSESVEAPAVSADSAPAESPPAESAPGRVSAGRSDHRAPPHAATSSAFAGQPGNIFATGNRARKARDRARTAR